MWRLVLLWLSGADLRLTLLAVPPVLPLIRQDLQLDEKGVAALSGAPLLPVIALPGVPLVVAAAVLGFCAAYVLVPSFALAPLLSAPGDVARMSAGAFSISYTTTFVVTLLAGAAWDATRIAASAFLPVVAAMAIVVTLAPRLLRVATGSSRFDVGPGQRGSSTSP